MASLHLSVFLRCCAAAAASYRRGNKTKDCSCDIGFFSSICHWAVFWDLRWTHAQFKPPHPTNASAPKVGGWNIVRVGMKYSGNFNWLERLSGRLKMEALSDWAAVDAQSSELLLFPKLAGIYRPKLKGNQAVFSLVANYWIKKRNQMKRQNPGEGWRVFMLLFGNLQWAEWLHFSTPEPNLLSSCL